MNKRKKLGKNVFANLSTNIILILSFSFLLFPVYWIFTMAIKTNPDILTYPPKFFFQSTIKGFQYILGLTKVTGATGVSAGVESYFLIGIKNSIIVVVSTILISLAAGLPAAYALARGKLKSKENIAFTILSFRFAPPLLVIVPLYLLFSKIGLYNSYFSLIWVYQLISLPMILWIVRGYMEDIPIEIEQAGMVDGHSRIWIFFRIVLPLAKGGIAAGTLLAFIYCWNNFIFGMILASVNVQPVTVQAMRYLTPDAIMFREVAAICIGAALPLLILSTFLQGYLISGLSMGAIRR
ncbi:MAG: carbohydrate ABC transporter permease [Spirochaetaceae bacterium]|nr:carbohydrate ABC transporter permease [Spirochaetaceae bacterium]